eukprot:17459-Heterococcus_DN1.PRE.7
MHNSASITHDGIKCPSLKCNGFLTLDDIKALTVVSIALHKLTMTEYSRIEVFIQDAQVLHSAPADAIVYCSAKHCERPNAIDVAAINRKNITLTWSAEAPPCTRCGTQLCDTYAPDEASQQYISNTSEPCPKCNNKGITEHLQQRGDSDVDGGTSVDYDSRCKCPICPDCKPNKPCGQCNGYCVVCKGIVTPTQEI